MFDEHTYIHSITRSVVRTLYRNPCYSWFCSKARQNIVKLKNRFCVAFNEFNCTKKTQGRVDTHKKFYFTFFSPETFCGCQQETSIVVVRPSFLIKTKSIATKKFSLFSLKKKKIWDLISSFFRKIFFCLAILHSFEVTYDACMING
jgi:hypothetical protein